MTFPYVLLKIDIIVHSCLFQEKGLRELAAEAVSALAKYEPDYFAGYVLEKIIPLTLSSDLCTRHGATLAAGELTITLHRLGFVFPAGW